MPASSARRRGPPRSDTRERLLAAACRQFAAVGYHGARIQEICREAEANIAAVNYHFGGKEGLYKAVWDYALSCAVATGLEHGGRLSGNDDREWLYEYVRACVRAVFDTGDGGLLSRLMVHEAASPSPFSEQLLSEHLAPSQAELSVRLRRMLGPDATEWQLGCCAFAIHSQFTALALNRSARKSLFRAESPTEDEVEQLAREICAFTAGGIRAIRAVPPMARRSRVLRDSPRK